MLFLEMSRDKDHGGGQWGFLSCLWAPTKKTDESAWPYWSKLLRVQGGDLVLHLRGIPPDANFVGYSEAASNGYVTEERPPQPGAWGYSKDFYRVDLRDFVPLATPINLSAVFASKRIELETYFKKNREKTAEKLSLFFVQQSGKLQCLNGAYLSDVDDTLLHLLLDETPVLQTSFESSPRGINVGTRWTTARARIGQHLFSRAVREQYGWNCCFPDCNVSDPRFLIGAHIARWSDNDDLRGHLGNGLCFCLMHDRAFELGLFTLDSNCCVYMEDVSTPSASSMETDLRRGRGREIRSSAIRPLPEALSEHWRRTNLFPPAVGS
jgi:putative restriction endonuclease